MDMQDMFFFVQNGIKEGVVVSGRFGFVALPTYTDGTGQPGKWKNDCCQRNEWKNDD